MVLLLLLAGLAAAFGAPFLDDIICENLQRNPPSAIAEHIKTLARKRGQLVYTDEYGQDVLDRWHKERGRFIENILRPQLTDLQRRAKYREVFSAEIERQISRFAGSAEPFKRDMAPIQYEHYCAAIMRRVGWNAAVTKASGDQGADVIAEANGLRIVLQCKLINGSTGNKAVQEVSAARLHYGCDYAAVVTHIGYTQSARRLAATNGISLLQHDDLEQWASNLLRNPKPTTMLLSA